MDDILTQVLKELHAILLRIQEEKGGGQASREVSDGDLSDEPFFSHIRKPLFSGRLTQRQVSGMKAKLTAFREAGFPLSHAAYAMATSYHETGRRMQPVREGFDVSDAWRKRNLRYYPYYGRGDVQLTWLDNYRKADKELALEGRLLSDLDLALDPDISARVLVEGLRGGWFGKDKAEVPYTLDRMLPATKATRAQFRQARRMVNILDKADTIAGYALIFQDALEAMDW